MEKDKIIIDHVWLSTQDQEEFPWIFQAPTIPDIEEEYDVKKAEEEIGDIERRIWRNGSSTNKAEEEEEEGEEVVRNG